MAHNPFQVSGRDAQGNIYVVGAGSFKDFQRALEEWFDDPADAEALLTQGRSTLLPVSAGGSDNGGPAPAPSGGGKPNPPGSGASGKVYLNVPFDDKDEAKRLGARWDGDAKKWAYNPRFVDPANQAEMNLRWPNR